MRLHRVVTAAFTLSLLFAAPTLAQETAEDLYQAGLYQEEVQGNLEQAIEIFERILRDHPGQRTVAAQALMHVGLCYEKLGSQEAQRAYQRLLRDYVDQIAVADRARLRLASLQGLARAEAPAEIASAQGIVVRHLRGGTPGYVLDATGEPSPDGRYLAGVDWGTTSNIAVLDLVTGESRQLTDHPDYEEGMALSAGFSTDGNTIAYGWLNADESSEVRLAFRDGTPPRTLCAEPGYEFWPGPWARDGRHIVVSRVSREGDGSTEMGWASVEDGSFRVFKSYPGRSQEGENEEFFRNLILGGAISPDDRHIVFDRTVAGNPNHNDISMVATDGSAEVTVVEHPANDRVLGWVPDTPYLLFVSDRSGTWDLYAIEVVGGEVRGSPWMVRRNVGHARPMGFTQDGSLFYWTYTLQFPLSIAPFDVETGQVRENEVRPLLGSKGQPAWSADGRYLAYWRKADWPSGAHSWDQILAVRDVETGGERELATHLDVEMPSWSRDGQSILVIGIERAERNNQEPAVYRVDVETQVATPLLLFPPDPEWWWSIGARWASDGHGLIYVRDGRLVLHDVNTHAEVELYRHPGLISQLLSLSPDGEKLLFAVADSTWANLQRGTVNRLHGDVQGKLMIARLPEGEIYELLRVELESGASIRNVDWGPDGRYVYFTETRAGENTVLNRVPIQGGEVARVWVSQQPIHEFTISPGGQQVAYTRGENNADIYVMENLKAFLRNKEDNR